jgi:hypothetical protein
MKQDRLQNAPAINCYRLRLMRCLVIITGTWLLIGCQSQHASRDDAGGLADSYQRHAVIRIEDSLERRVTVEEARHMALDSIDHTIQVAKNEASDQKLPDHLARNRELMSSRLESFLARLHEGDQLWSYRAYDTVDRRGGESGFAIVREGKVVEYVGFVVYD